MTVMILGMRITMGRAWTMDYHVVSLGSTSRVGLSLFWETNNYLFTNSYMSSDTQVKLLVDINVGQSLFDQ